MLIGWFLSHLATASYTQTLTEKMLESRRVRDLMRTRFERVAATTRLDEFAEGWLLRSNQLLWPVYGPEGETLGVVTLADVAAHEPDKRGRLSVADVMTPLSRLQTLREDQDAMEASALLAQAGDQPLAVMRGEDLVGLIRGADVLRWMTLHKQDERPR
jgi:CBS-domain-containing membrane protein